MTVRQLALRGGVSVHVVRTYLRRGILQAERRTDAGYQLFSETELRRLQFIRACQQLGFTLAEVEEIIRESRLQRSPCPLVRNIMQRRLAETAEQLAQLQALQERMTQASERWASLPDSVPNGSDVCQLIETVAAELPIAFDRDTRHALLRSPINSRKD